ncbi:hypothetical protein J3F83DRAFT_738387 [Trichoderma novae-zelandiae]
MALNDAAEYPLLLLQLFASSFAHFIAITSHIGHLCRGWPIGRSLDTVSDIAAPGPRFSASRALQPPEPIRL